MAVTDYEREIIEGYHGEFTNYKGVQGTDTEVPKLRGEGNRGNTGGTQQSRGS